MNSLDRQGERTMDSENIEIVPALLSGRHSEEIHET